MASRCSSFLPEDDCDSQDRHLLGDNYPHNATSVSRPSLSIINKELDVSSMGEITKQALRGEVLASSFTENRSPEQTMFQPGVILVDTLGGHCGLRSRHSVARMDLSPRDAAQY